jgi:TonB family protein
VTDRQLLVSLAASLTIHLALVPLATRFIKTKQSIALPLPIQLLEVPTKQGEEFEPNPPETRSKPEKITAPRLLSKPQILGSSVPDSPKNVGELTNNADKTLETHGEPRSSDLSETALGGRSDVVGAKSGGEGSAPAGGIVIDDAGQATSGPSGDSKSVGSGGGTGPSRLPSIDARPLAGYQSKPRYPDSARRARAQGTTYLKFRVLATGKVGEVLIEKSAGRRDLDEAAADAVKKWLFEPARVGTEAVSVWVILPVEFKLN